MKIGWNYAIIRVMKEIIEPEIIKEQEPVKEEKKKPGRPTILTPELRDRLIKLFEEHFFIAIVAARSDIYRERIYEWQKEQEDFRIAVTHARNKWIEQQMELLREYAIDKREKDWRALKYLLSIADVEYNDKKFLREAPGKKDSTQITIIINRKDLETSKEEAIKVIGEGSTEEETISLIPFQTGKKAKKGKKEAGDKAKRG
ncbi:hypothetical protein ES705_24667 [subsurface metagenome]